jgi:hypothetical protein
MEWKSIVDASDREIQESIEEKEKEIRLRMDGWQRAKNISLKVKEVTGYFHGMIRKRIDSDGDYSIFGYGWGSLDYETAMQLKEGSAHVNIEVFVHPFCSVCSKEIIGGDYVAILFDHYEGESILEKIGRLYPLVSTSHGDPYERHRMPYHHFDPREKFIKIPFKDFTEERLAKILNDIYVMASKEL